MEPGGEDDGVLDVLGLLVRLDEPLGHVHVVQRRLDQRNQGPAQEERGVFPAKIMTIF